MPVFVQANMPPTKFIANHHSGQYYSLFRPAQIYSKKHKLRDVSITETHSGRGGWKTEVY